MKRAIYLVLFGFLSLEVTAQIAYEEVAEEKGLGFQKGWGNTVIDYDGDGWNDLFILGRFAANRLYKNNGDGSFTDVTEEAGLFYLGTSKQTPWADIDNDGDLDFYDGTSENAPNRLYLNNGDGTFSEIAESAGVADTEPIAAALFADIDGDGFVDLYLAIAHLPNKLYYNNGDNTFTDITEFSRAVDSQFAMGSGFFDYDNDGDQDLYLVHDDDQPNILYQNLGNGQFRDVSVESGTNYAGQGMAPDFGDYNNDGWLDIYITNMFSNTLYRNNGDGTFTDVTEEAGVGDLGMGWGVTWLDHNNDGWEDIYVANNSYFLDPGNVLYENQGDGTFRIVSENTVLESPFSGYSVATGDLDNDGDLELWLGNVNEMDRAELFLNEQENGNYITFSLTGTESNRAAIGARITVTLGEMTLSRELRSGTGYGQQNSLDTHFGLGEQQVIDEVTVSWPSGTTQEFVNVSPNQRYFLLEGGDLSLESVVTSTEDDPEDITDIVSIFPNPVNDVLQVRLPGPITADTSLQMINNQGKLISLSQEPTVDAEGLINIDMSGLPNGLYLLEVWQQGGRAIHKVLKQSR